MKYVFPIFIFILLSSCFSEGDCLVPATNQMYIQFKKNSAKTTDTLLYFSTIKVNGVTQKVSSSTASLLLSLDIMNNTTSFVFSRRNPLDTQKVISVDTLKVSYTRQTKVLGKNCGAYQFYQNLKIEKTSPSFSKIKAFNNYLIKDPSTQNYALNYQLFF